MTLTASVAVAEGRVFVELPGFATAKEFADYVWAVPNVFVEAKPIPDAITIGDSVTRVNAAHVIFVFEPSDART